MRPALATHYAPCLRRLTRPRSSALVEFRPRFRVLVTGSEAEQDGGYGPGLVLLTVTQRTVFAVSGVELEQCALFFFFGVQRPSELRKWQVLSLF